MIKVLERATGTEFVAKAIEGGYEVFTQAGEKYKKIKESTFKRYFKAIEDDDFEDEVVDKPEEPKPEPKKAKPEPETSVEVTGEKRQQIIAKIKKLMALSENNPSQEEALSAALMAQKLMAKYRISEDETLEEIKEDDVIDSVFSDQKHNSHLLSWRKQLAVIVARNFCCKCYIRKQDIVFRGYKQDAEVALSVYLYLYTVGNRLGTKAYFEALEKTGSGRGVYNSFVSGFLKGINEGLSVQCTALMLIVPQAVEDEFRQFSANFKSSTTKLIVTDQELFEKGRIEGKNAVKARALEKKGGKK